MAEKQEQQEQTNYNPALLGEESKRKITEAVIETTTSVMNPIEHEQLRKLAKEYYAAGALPESYKSPEQVFLAMQFGRTMGMTPHESIVNGYFVSGSYNVYGKAIPAALRRHGWIWKFVNETEAQCGIKLENSETGETIEDLFTYQDAVDSGYTQKYGKESFAWKKGANRKRKLRYGVLSLVLHTYLPDVLGAVSGIAEYSEDYIEGQSETAEDRVEANRQRMEAAEARRKEMADNGFEPQVVEPTEEEATADAQE